jgi:hypothetical protein
MQLLDTYRQTLNPVNKYGFTTMGPLSPDMPDSNYVVPPLHIMLAFGATIMYYILHFNVTYIEE